MKRLGFLDALRGIAALAVVVQHLGERLLPAITHLTTFYFQLGQFGVVLFFICSGFVIPASIERHGSLLSFWIGRVSRLFPLYWLSLAGAIALFALGRFSLPQPFVDAPVASTIVNAAMLGGVLGVPYAIGTYWTLTFDMAFYVLSSVAFALGLYRRTVRLTVTALALSIVAGVGWPLLTGRPGPIGIGFNFATMLVGVVLYRYHSREIARRPVLVVLGLAVVAILAILAANLAGRDDPASGGARSFLPMLTAWLSAYALFLVAFGLRSRRPPAIATEIGRASYSVYLLHPLVAALLPVVVNPVVTATVWLAVILVVASVTYRLVELPFMNLGRYLQGRSTGVRGSAVPRTSLPAIVLAVVLAVGVAPGSARAQAVADDGLGGCQGSWIRQFAVDVLILDCTPGYATPHDRLYMFARRPVDPNADWRAQLDFTNAVWLFDAGARGKVSLLVDFRPQDGGLTAEIFDDGDGDGEVRYGLERGYPRSVETRFPSLRVLAPDGWWVRDGLINYNLKLIVDGSIPVWDAPAEGLPVDGIPDAVVNVYDEAISGRPSRQIAQLQPTIPERAGIRRTLLAVDETATQRLPEAFVLWPHIGTRRDPPPPSEAPLPPIQIDWEKARIAAIGELVVSRGRAGVWSVSSVRRFGPADLTVADDENPRAYYDLAGAADGNPDLAIRNTYYPPNDKFLPGPTLGPWNEVRYTWDPAHRRQWGFALDLFGRKPVPSDVVVGDVKVRSVAYRDYPSWVARGTWEAANFIVAESDVGLSPEGLDVWCTQCGDLDAYHAGLLPTTPLDAFRDIPIGLRGEFATRLGAIPQLYVGPIDRKLHLLNAEGGVWRVSASEQIRYSALGGSALLNRWDRLVEGVLIESLFDLADRLVFVGPDSVQIKPAPPPASGSPAPGELIQAPTSPAEWLSFQERLRTTTPAGEGRDLLALFERQPGAALTFAGVTAWDMQPTARGFRFLGRLDAAQNDSRQLRGLAPGTYVFGYETGAGISVRPARPAALTMSAPAVRGDAPAELAPARLVVELRNEGDETIAGLPVVFLAGRPGGPSQVVGWTTADVPPSGLAVAEAQWSPDPGDWSLYAVALKSPGAASPPLSLQVPAAPVADLTGVLLIVGLRPFAGGAITASLTLAIAISSGLGLAIWRTSARAASRSDR